MIIIKQKTFPAIQQKIMTAIYFQNQTANLAIYTANRSGATGTATNVWTFSGQSNTNDSFRVIDLKGNALKSSIGPGLILDASTNSVPLSIQTANTGPTGSGSGL